MNLQSKNLKNPHEMVIKIAVIRWLMNQHGAQHLRLMVNEFTANNSNSRADLMAVIDNDIVAIEIKSNNDQINRLEGQLSRLRGNYNRVDVVVAKKHVSSARVICRDFNVGLHTVDDFGLVTFAKGRRRKIDPAKLSKTLFPTSERGKRDFLSSQSRYIEYILKKYSSSQFILNEIRNKPYGPSPDDVKLLNPHHENRLLTAKKKVDYFSSLVKNFSVD